MTRKQQGALVEQEVEGPEQELAEQQDQPGHEVAGLVDQEYEENLHCAKGESSEREANCVWAVTNEQQWELELVVAVKRFQPVCRALRMRLVPWEVRRGLSYEETQYYLQMDDMLMASEPARFAVQAQQVWEEPSQQGSEVENH